MKYILALVLTTFFFAAVVSADEASANFNAGRIIDDSVMADYNSMNAGDIQRFLESKVTCDTWGTKKSEYGGGTRAQYAASRGWQAPPYYCMTTYKENGVSAAQLIYDKAQKYQISPKVLIVLLQKEQGLITDEWPTYSPQYKTATGYGCPDTAPCDSQYFGLGNQLDWAAKMFRSIMNASPGWYTPYVLGNNYIQYNPSASCGGSTVNIQNRATQALYNYTPYQPNQAALDAGWGTAPCGAYGNRNFYLYYTSWFGAISGPAYAWQEVGKTFYTDDTKSTLVDPNSVFQSQYLYVEYKVRNIGSYTWKNRSVRIGRQSNLDSKFCTSEWIACNRPANILEDEVKPGEIGTITFWAQAPSETGNYKEYYNLLIENTSWFVDIGSYWNIKVNTGNATNSLNSQKRTLKKGEMIQSVNRQHVLTLTPHGTLELHSNKVKKWQVEASDINMLITQTDGNLVAYDSKGVAVWSRHCMCGKTGDLKITENGELSFESNVISSTNMDAAAYPVLGTNQTLFRGQSIQSENGKYTLVFQEDGNLVEYGPKGVVWATNRNSGYSLVQQNDGNLVVYNSLGRPIWASNRSGKNVTTYIQDDGNIVSYDSKGAIWSR